MAETQDAEYSDEEFGSDHEDYEGGYEDFADEDVEADTAQDAAHDESPEEADEEDKYDEEVEEDAEQYDNEFDEDERTAAKIDAEIDVMEQRPTAVAADPPVSNLDVEGSPETNVAPDESHGDASDDSEADYSNDTEHDIPAPPKPVSLSRDASEENVAKRRASVPASVITKLSDEDSPRARVGSMPMILPDRPVDKWLETIPHELSPERSDRSRMQSALPVLDEVLAQNPLDEESSEDETASGVATNSDSNAEPIISHSRTRAQSYQGLQSEKTTVPMRKAQSLLYTGSLPSVVEIHAADGIAEADSNNDSEDPYSDEDDGDNYADSQTSFQSEDENDATQPVNVERPKSGPSVIPHQGTAPIDDNTLDDHPAETEVNSSVPTSDFNSNPSTTLTPTAVAPDEQNLLGKSETPEPQQNNTENDDYADEMEDEFPTDTNTPHFEDEDTPHKSSGEASDFDVDEFIEDGRRETETLLLEARSLLLQQQQHDTAPPVEQTTATSDIPTTNDSGADLKEEFAKIAEKAVGIGDEKYSTPYDDDEEFADGDDEAPAQVLSEQELGDAHDIVGQYEFDTDDFNEHESEALIQDNCVTPPQLVDADKTPDLDSPPSTITVDTIQPSCETHSTSESAPQVENEVSLAIPSETLVSGGVVLEAIEAQYFPVQSPQLAQPLSSNADENEMAATTQEASQSNRPTKTRVPSQPVAPKPSAETVNTSSLKQSSPPMKPSRPPGKRPAPATPVPSSDIQHITTPRASRNKLRVVASECKSSSPNHTSETAGINSIETCASKSPPRRRDSPSKSRHGVSSPRSPSTAYSGPYQYLSNEYPPLPRKEPVPRQKVSSKPSTSGEAKRRLLQPVRTPANLRFDLLKMDKAKRDWLFVNMFRHGDDLSKYEAFVPPALLAKPPATKETKKRPLSARQVYGNPHTSQFPSSGRKLVQQPNQDRERKWVATTPHDSKLPPYDSILDKYCTTVTSPMIQRQIYQTRHRDLSPQLAFVLEKRVEKHFRKGFYDSFGGVSSSYKTEIVPTSPTDGTRSRQLSPRSPTKSGVLEKQLGSPVAEE